MDVDGFAKWALDQNKASPIMFAVVPDIIDGTAEDNDALLSDWPSEVPGAPVWHLHESVGRLRRLTDDAAAGRWDRVCFGSSGEFKTPGTIRWWRRMGEAMRAICDVDGKPPCRLHGLRMLSPKIVPRLGGFASADSTNVAQNHHRTGDPGSLARFIERHTPPAAWAFDCQTALFGF